MINSNNLELFSKVVNLWCSTLNEGEDADVIIEYLRDEFFPYYKFTLCDNQIIISEIK